MKPVKILYAEDDETLAFLTADNLRQNGFEVVHCASGNDCMKAFRRQGFDICVLDIMLPGMDGFELTTEIRKADPDIPILFLSAKTLKEDRIKGLKLGADDYLVKPFSIEELVLKIGIFMNRSRKNIPDKVMYQLGAFTFTPDEFLLNKGKTRITLTEKEASLLKYFLDNENKVLKREHILKALWGSDDYFMGRSLDVFISRLRKILSDEKNISIQNLHGIGFKYSEQKD